MKIDIFKNDGLSFFQSLEGYLPELQQLFETFNAVDKPSDWWFEPKLWKDQEAVQIGTQHLLRRNQLEKALLYNVCIYTPNYLTLFLVNKFYADKKDILIEDACAGDGRLCVFLHKLGYKHFSIFEDFSQVRKLLLDGVMASYQLKYILNDYDAKPIVINLAGYPVYPKKEIYDSTELICTYGNVALAKQMKKLFKDRYVELCVDFNNISIAYCRKDKYEYFSKIIKQYEK